MSDAERDSLASLDHYQRDENGYARIQGTRPQTIGYALDDSPAGLAAWIVEKFRAWTDCDGDVERCLTKDVMLDNIMLYWLTGTAHSAGRLYYEIEHGGASAPNAFVEVPVGVAAFPREVLRFPRSWAELRYNIVRWTDMPRGGHFAALEQPELLVDDVRSFFRTGALNALAWTCFGFAAAFAVADWWAVATHRACGSSTCASRRPRWRSSPPRSRSIPSHTDTRVWFCVALGFCVLGDVFLMLPSDAFVPGLASFLVAQLCFAVGFALHLASGRQLALGIVLVVVIAAPLATRFRACAWCATGVVRSWSRCSHTWPRSGRWSPPRSVPAGVPRSRGPGCSSSPTP